MTKMWMFEPDHDRDIFNNYDIVDGAIIIAPNAEKARKIMTELIDGLNVSDFIQKEIILNECKEGVLFYSFKAG